MTYNYTDMEPEEKMLVEIKPQWQHDLEKKPMMGDCPKCGGNLAKSSVPCPDNHQGCLVAHYGLRCCACGASFRHG